MKRPAGFSLLEVLLATAILLGCVVVLGHLASIGRARANSARDLADAQRICQNRMNELLAGEMPLDTSEDVPLADEPGWLCTTDLEPAARPGMAVLRVTVIQDLPEGKRPVQFSLVHWIRDPRRSDREADSVGPSRFMGAKP